MVKTIVIYLSGVLAFLALGLVQAAPYFVAAGTARSGTGTVTVAWPTHATNDIALLFVESAGAQPVTLTTPSGFVQVTNSPQFTGTGTAGTRLSVYWARATSTAMPSVVVADPGDHVYARIVTYRGVIQTGNPWDVTAGGIKATASTSVSVVGVTTTVADTLVVQAVSRDNDSSSSTAFSAQANVNLAAIAERSDGGTTSGNGGGIGVWDGILATATTSGNTAATVANSINAFMSIALKSVPGAAAVISDPTTCSSVTGVGTIAWINPLNAKTSDNVYATAGSVIRNTTTNYLNCTGFNFSTIPANGSVTDITVFVERKTSGGTIRDAFVYLIKGGVIQTTVNGATLTNYTTTDFAEPHGGANPLWGTTWSVAELQAANFGVAFAAKNNSTTSTTNRTVSVDNIQVRVSYLPNPFHHAAIAAPTSAMTLSPTAVTITPHTSAHGAISAAGSINLSTSTGAGNWTIGNGTGTLTPGAANSGQATYTFGIGESSVSLDFTSQAAGAVTINVADSLGVDMLANTPAGEKANTITFASPTYVFTSSVCTHGVAFGTAGQCALVNWSPRTAGQVFGNIYITAVNGAGVPTRLHASQNVNRSLQFGLSCHDPVANAGVQATFSATASSLSLCKSNGATPTSWTTAVTLTFAAGSPSVGPYSFNYNDVGKVDLWMRNSAATSETGSSGVFVVKPAGFTLSNITRSSDGFANPAATNASGTAFVKAGESFSATVTARNAGGTITPNFGQEVAPETVKLSPDLVVGLGLTSNPAINGAFGGFGVAHPSGSPSGVAGVAHGIAFSWDEVGVITLTPSVGDSSYLGAGDVLGTPSGNVGRFSLGKFALQNVTLDERADLCQGGFLVSDGVTPCASNFTYMDEQIDANFTLVPASLNGAIVHNYVDSATPANDFAKLDPSTFANLNLAAVDRTTSGGPYYLTSRLSNSGVPAATCETALCFETGVASLTVPFKFSRNVSADGVYGGVDLGIAPVDGDGARVEGVGAVAGLCNKPNAVDCYDLDVDAVAGDDRAAVGNTEFRYGRSRIASAHGSELLPLRLQIMTEYWSGGAYVASVDDSLSVLTIGLGNYQKNLASGETLLTQPVIASGSGQIGLSRPGAGNNGSVDVTVTSPAYLPGNTGRATFGVFKGSNEFIYLREAY